jgi:glutathione S-transferase
MILIGQYDSPFVRRVGIALTLHGHAFEHRPWSVFGDTERIRPLNPLVRVPTLVLDDGEVLVESNAILDHLDDVAPPGSALIARAGPERRHAMKVIALAMGAAEQAVGLFYELRLHERASPVLVERRTSQILGALDALERDGAARSGFPWFGDRLGHADIAVAVTIRFVTEAHPGLIAERRLPALAAHAAACEALPVFRAIAQPFVPPA